MVSSYPKLHESKSGVDSNYIRARAFVHSWWRHVKGRVLNLSVGYFGCVLNHNFFLSGRLLVNWGTDIPDIGGGMC